MVQCGESRRSRAGPGPEGWTAIDTVGQRYQLAFEDTFDGTTLDTGKWLPHYLPQWSTRERSAARYRIADGELRLRIDEDQQPWCPEFDGALKVSSLQTGVYSGPLGSRIGQHRFTDAAVVREEQRPLRLFTPHYGRFELRAKVSDDPATMAALWMIGFEDEPHRSAEICIMEVFGRDVHPDRGTIGMGLHPFGDPTIADDFAKVEVQADLREFHVYGAEWTPEQVVFHFDGHPVRTVAQSPDYPMQFMLNIYEFPDQVSDRPYPKEFVVDWFRAYSSVEAQSTTD